VYPGLNRWVRGEAVDHDAYEAARDGYLGRTTPGSARVTEIRTLRSSPWANSASDALAVTSAEDSGAEECTPDHDADLARATGDDESADHDGADDAPLEGEEDVA